MDVRTAAALAFRASVASALNANRYTQHQEVHARREEARSMAALVSGKRPANKFAAPKAQNLPSQVEEHS